MASEKIALTQMDNSGFENEREVNHNNHCHTEIQPAAPDTLIQPEEDTEHEADCACVESQTHCKCATAARQNRKIEARAWVKPKGWMLLGMAVALVAWTAIFFTLAGLGYI